MNQFQSSKFPHILLVEDNPGDVLLIKECFRDIGKPHFLSVAKDGEEALEFLKQKGKYEHVGLPNLVLLDLNLPKVSGHEVLAFVKGNPELKKIPVLVLSTSRASTDIQKAYALAANCYLCKPSTLEEFRHLVNIIQEFWLELVWFSNPGTPIPAR